MSTLTHEMRKAIIANAQAVFADQKATSDQVLEAMIGYLTANDVKFYTASGEIAEHLQKAVEAMRGRGGPEVRRRYLGMPKEEGDAEQQSSDS